jgi:hypothetical protein
VTVQTDCDEVPKSGSNIIFIEKRRNSLSELSLYTEEAGFSHEADLTALTGFALDTHFPITTHLTELSDVQVDRVTVKSFSVSGTLLLTSEAA